MTSLFCRHNRFTADCPICSKGTVLDPERGGSSSSRASRGDRPRPPAGRGAGKPAPPDFRGPYAASGPYDGEGGERYEVRLERVPGGIRLGEWSSGALRRRAPVLPGPDLLALVASAVERGVLPEPDGAALVAAVGRTPEGGATPEDGAFGASPGRAGDMREELRIERLPERELVRVARWVVRPGRGPELHDAPPMLPAKRYAEALAAAARNGALAAGPGASDAAGPPPG